MKTKTLRISAIAIFAAILTLGISSCSGGGQGNQDRGSHQTHDQSHDVEVGDVQLAEFSVNGNCSMCKQRIEEAATSVSGVTSAEWDVNAKTIEIAMDQGTDLHEVHMAIAKAGHDTEMHRATDEAYDNLHACCKYERE
jgi:periplasmic mercuric ion binding protein